MSKVLVIGSLNMDMTVRVDNLPKLGETIFGKEYYESCGGKGLNQAVAISKLGVKTEMIGTVGNDDHGKKLKENLNSYNVVTDNIFVSSENVTGRALINVDDNGNNNIIVIPGSNFDIKTTHIDSKMDIIKNSDVIVLQNEIPLDVIAYILRKSRENGKTTMYNPAPAKKLNTEILQNTDYLVINETEMEEIFEINKNDKFFVEKICNIKKEKHIKNIILTLGSSGSLLLDEYENVQKYKAYKVNAVDTTAAGDTFLGAFISKLIETDNKDLSMKFATAASAIVVTRKGAADSIPTKEEVEQFLAENEFES